jgi:RNA-splicing ligase RtcB
MKWKIEDTFTCIHNYVDFSNAHSGADADRQTDIKPILRKGAISAKEGEKVIIPINMRDGIILGTGLGNPDWNFSGPHGAGRIYKRSEVAEHHTVSDFKKAMKGIYSICINKYTLDESPFAYRSIDDIAEVIGETVKIDKIIKPVYNYKAGGTN